MGQRLRCFVNCGSAGRQLFALQGKERGSRPGGRVAIRTPGRLQAAGAETSRNWRQAAGSPRPVLMDNEPSVRPAARRGPPAPRVRGLPASRVWRSRGHEDQEDDVLIGEAAATPGAPVDLHLAPGTADNILADAPRTARTAPA